MPRVLSVHPISLLLFVIFISMVSPVSGQVTPSEKQADKEETVNLVDISKQSSQAILETRQINERLITMKSLLQKKRKVDSLVNRIKKKLKKDKSKNMDGEGMRNLETSLISLQQEKSLVNDKKKELNSLLNNLVANKDILTNNLQYWEKVKQTIRTKKMGKTVENSANEVISVLSSTLYTLSRLTNVTMEMIRNISATELEIDTRISDLIKARQKIQGELLSSLQPSLFALDYSGKATKKLSEAITRFYEVDRVNLKSYLKTQLSTLVFHLILIVVLIVVFIRLSKTPVPLEIGEGLPHKKRLKQLLSRPISTALILGLFSTTILYSNSPLVFRDIMLLLLIFPMTILLKAIFNKQFRLYIYALAIISVSMIIYPYLPVNNVYARFLLLFIGLTELFTVLHFTLRYKSEVVTSKKTRRLILFLSYAMLIVIVTGITGNLFGKVMLSRYLLFSFSEMIVVLFLVMVTAIILNGLSVIFITGSLAGQSNFIRKNKRVLLKKIPRFINLVALLVLFHYLLKILGWESSLVNALGMWLGHEYQLGSITFSWGRLFIFLFIIWFSIFIARIVRDVLEDDILNKVKMEEGLPHTIALMARYTLITVGILLAFSALGMPMSDLAIMFSALGVGIGFGLQNIFNNIVSGFILLFERPIKIGDTIEVGELVGTVRSIGIRASNIRTFDGAEIIVPNGNLISNEVVNWTLSDQRRRIEIKVNVAYDSDPEKVKEVLLRLLENHGDVAKDPKPGIYFIEMGQSALVFRILFWTHQYGKWYSIRSKMMYDVFRALKEAGIEIPFSQLDLHIRDTNTGKTGPKMQTGPNDSG